MSVTVSTKPNIHSNSAEFEIASSLSEDASHVNLRVEASIFTDGGKTIKSVKPKGLLDFNFSKILNSLIQFTTPDWRETEGDTLIGVEKTGSNLITGFTNAGFDTFVSSGATVSSAIDAGAGISYFYAQSNAFTVGKVYVLRMINYVSTGADNPIIYGDYLRGRFEDIGNDRLFYFIAIDSTPDNLRIENTVGNSVNFSADFELYELENTDWYKMYSVTFTEKWENASGVTQSGTAVTPDEAFIFFRSEGLTSAEFIADYICEDGYGYPLEQERNVAGTYRGATLFRSDQEVSAYLTHVIGNSVTDVIFTRAFYNEAGTLVATENTTTTPRYSPIYIAAVSTLSFSSTRFKALCYIKEGTSRVSSDFLIQTKGCSQTEIPVMLHWINRYGGLSTAVFYGDSKLTGEVTRDEYQDISKITKYKKAYPFRKVRASTDYIPQTSVQEYDRLFWESLLASTSTWIHVGASTSFRATLVTNSFTITPKKKNLWTIDVSVVYNMYEESISAYVPVTPDLDTLGLYGFGSESLVAYGDIGVDPKIMVVDRLTYSYTDGAADTTSGNNIDYRGSLNYCLRQSFPRIVLFEVSGTIDMKSQSYMRILDTASSTVGFCWVVGQSAPSPGVEVIGTTLWIDGVSDVLFTHITLGLGDTNEVAGMSDRDVVTIAGAGSYLTAQNILFNHCDLRWCTDDILDSKAHQLNISECIFSEPLVRSAKSLKSDTFHPPHSVTQGTAFFYRNVFAYAYDRPPWFLPNQSNDSNKCAFINNIFYNYYRTGAMFGLDYASATLFMEVVYKGNYVRPFKTDASSANDACANLRVAQNTGGLSKFYFDDNISNDKDGGDSDWTSIDGYSNWAAGNESSAPFDISGIPIVPASQTKASVLATVGSKWRDAHTQRVLTGVSAEVIDARELLDSPQALPARAVNFFDSSGNVPSGFDWATTPQGFTINVNGAGALAVTLNTNCTTIAQVVTHINARLTAAGVSGAEAYLVAEDNTPNNYVGIRTTSSGASQTIVITSSTCTAIDLVNGTYTGQDAVSGGYLTRANNSHVLSIPDNPHDLVGSLRRIESWIMDTFDQTAVNI